MNRPYILDRQVWGSSGQLVWVSKAGDSQQLRLMEVAVAETEEGSGGQGDVLGACFSHTPRPLRHHFRLWPPHTSWPCPRLLISTQSRVTDFSNLTLLSCLRWSRWLGPACVHLGRPWDVTFSPAWPWGLGPCSLGPGCLLSRLPEACWGAQAQEDLAQLWVGSLWRKGGRARGGRRQGRSRMGRSTPGAVTRVPRPSLAYIRPTKPGETWDSGLMPGSASPLGNPPGSQRIPPSLAYRQHLVLRGHCLCSQQWYLQEHAGTGFFRELKDGAGGGVWTICSP